MATSTALIGSGPATVLKFKDGFNGNAKMICNSDTTNGNSRIYIANLKLDGNNQTRQEREIMSEFINNYSKRMESIKQALKEIHNGKPYKEVKGIFSEVLKSASAQEIAKIEQTLISEGLPVEDI